MDVTVLTVEMVPLEEVVPQVCPDAMVALVLLVEMDLMVALEPLASMVAMVEMVLMVVRAEQEPPAWTVETDSTAEPVVLVPLG